MRTSDEQHPDRDPAAERVALAAAEAAGAVRAPARLHHAVAELERARRPQARRRRVALGGALAAGAGAAAAVLAVALPGGAAAPSVPAVAALSSAGPLGPAPAVAGSGATRLAREVDAVYFPNWSRRFGWSASGARSDTLRGRTVKTVYYTRSGASIAYAIVDGGALPRPTGTIVTRDGAPYTTLTSQGRTIVTWRRNGHTCVLAARGVPAAEMVRLAAWRVRA